MLQQIRSSLDWVASGIFDRPVKPSKATLQKMEHTQVIMMLMSAMSLLKDAPPPEKAHTGSCGPETSCDSSCAAQYHWIAEYMKLEQLYKEWATTKVMSLTDAPLKS